MFGLKRTTPVLPPFSHTDDCKILKADPEVEIQWSYEGNGLWTAACVCTVEHYREPFIDDRVRQDPLDPKTSHHFGQCEYAGETDRATLKLLLRVTPKDGYSWTECSACESGWQVADSATPGGA